jgi:hypothetical protein
MHLRRRVPPPVQPLRLQIERYVHCPRGGLVRVERCADCELMQGTLLGERPELLCAYPEPAPALHAGTSGGGWIGTQDPPEARPSGDGGRSALAVAKAPGERAGAAKDRASALIFDLDWPDE